MKHKILFFALFLFILNSAFAQFGYLDKTFSNDGIAELNTGVQKRQNSQSTQVIPNTDGSLLILFQSSAQSLLIKKFANGVTDSSYGINGLSVPVPVQGSKAVKQPDGKIIIVGHTGSMPLHDNSGEYPEEKGTFINEDFALTRLNTDGSLDLAFGNKGLQKTDFSTYYDAINSVAIQPDGKILVSGITALYSPVPDADGFDTHLYDRVAVARYTNIGLPDLSFDGDGKFITNIRTNDLTSNLIALQSDGKFIIAASDTTGFSLARFTNTGSSDNSFAFSDKLLRPDGSYFAVRSLVVQSDDKIVLGGLWNNTNTQKDFVIVRYGANGALDKSFNTTGIKTTDFRGYNDYNTSLFIQKDGKVIAGGYASNGTSYAFATSRYNTNGSTDSTYSADGEQVSYHGSNDLRTAGLSLQPDGKIILAGFDGTPFFSITNTVVARYNADGSLDKTFNKTGGLIYEFKIGNTVFKSSVVQPDGKLIAAGYTWNGTDNDFLLVRYNIDGSPDNTFSGDGIQITNVNASDNINTAVTLQKDGKILISGSSKNNANLDFTLVRYNSNGSLDNTFSGDGVLISDFGANEDISALTVQPDGKIVVVGSYNGAFIIARFNNNGSIDGTFGNGGKRTGIILQGEELSAANLVAIDGNGKIIVGTPSVLYSIVAILRFNIDGSLDKTFDNDGIAEKNLNDSEDYFWLSTQLIVQKDNKILLAGADGFSDRDERYPHPFLLRYNSNGSLDNTFSADGLTNPFPADSFADKSTVALQSDGKIILSARIFTFWNYGYRSLAVKRRGYALIRLKTDGTVDSTFGVNGIIYTGNKPFTGINSTSIFGGKLYAVGYNRPLGEELYEGVLSYGYVARYDLLTANTPPKVSITSPANKTGFPATTTSVTINITASDAGGFIQSVKLYLNDSYIKTDAAAPYSFILSNLTHGVYVVKAKATDNLGVETFSTPVTFAIGKAKPVVSITSPADSIRYSAPHDVTITATADDPDGTVKSVKFYNGYTYIKTDFTAPYSYTFSSLPRGNYTFKVKATDNEGYEVFSDPVHVLIGTTPPQVVILSPQNNERFFTDLATFTIQAYVKDIDGYIARLDFYDGNILLGSRTDGGTNFTVSNLPRGMHTLKAKATDNEGNQSFSSPVSIVVGASPSLSITSPAEGAAITAGQSLTITANASQPNGSIVRLDFYNGDTYLGTDNLAPYSFTVFNLQAGNYTFAVTTTDDLGLTNSDFRHISVVPAGFPLVTLTSPSSDRVFYLGDQIKFSANASDPDGTVASVKFYANSTYLKTDFSAPYEYFNTSLPEGIYEVYAKATDNAGNESFSDSARMYVWPKATLSSSLVKNSLKKVDEVSAFAIELSPNPAKNILTISTKDFTKAGTTLLSILSSNGTIMKQMKMNAKMQTMSVDISTLHSGTYTLQLKSGDKTVTKQFIKL